MNKNTEMICSSPISSHRLPCISFHVVEDGLAIDAGESEGKNFGDRSGKPWERMRFRSRSLKELGGWKRCAPNSREQVRHRRPRWVMIMPIRLLIGERYLGGCTVTP